ncbi:phage tail fiber adhesin Gp38 family protein [Escherichia coli 2-460-02_S3_C1]|uniref:hypothetical protein n=1 Tax=Escherichia coli TaxID=562 RepID=UPI0004D438B4|nr:phage tail fiber adhesin Gp38 family protein [Escherichia coli 2-460-02_S3_C1]
MGVTSGWVGSSAKSETGEQWMGAAGTKLGLSKPFMMSQMVGRTMGCKIATEYYNGNPLTRLITGAQLALTGL